VYSIITYISDTRKCWICRTKWCKITRWDTVDRRYWYGMLHWWEAYCIWNDAYQN